MSDMSDSLDILSLRKARSSRRTLRSHLLSIISDSEVVYALREATRLPLVANLRNGLWYAPPELFEASSYFKSTDGHVNQWKFSATRMNLHVAQLAAAHKGCVIVDSTRRGKRFPDSLYTTIPIWMAILNKILFPALSYEAVYLSPPWMPPQIQAQIIGTLPRLLDSVPAASRDFIRSSLSGELSKPMKPVWVSPDRDGVLDWLGDIAEKFADTYIGGALSMDNESAEIELVAKQDTTDALDFLPIVLLCCSRDVAYEDQEEQCTWEYIKGAGDDEENWAKGLTPKLFWEHREFLLDTDDASHTDRTVNELVKCVPLPLVLKEELKIMTFTDFKAVITSYRSIPVDSFLKWKFIIVYSSTISQEAQRLVDYLVENAVSYLVLKIGCGKRDQPRNYWQEEVFPNLHQFANSNCYLCYDDTAADHLGICALMLITLVLVSKTDRETLAHSQPRSLKEKLRSILLQVQGVYPNVTPPRRHMKELGIYMHHLQANMPR